MGSPADAPSGLPNPPRRWGRQCYPPPGSLCAQKQCHCSNVIAAIPPPTLFKVEAAELFWLVHRDAPV